MQKLIIVAGFLILVVGVTVTILNKYNSQTVPEQQNESQIQTPQTDETMKQPKMTIDKNKTYTALMKTTMGDITLELNAKQTPVTVNNFVYLAKKKFYDNVIFHRVIKGFMIQGGDPTGTGSGGPGYRFADEKFDGEYTRGTVAMANAGPNTNGSQFFIMHKDNPLPKAYVIFGKVVKGIETVDAIADAPMQPGGEGSTPVDPVKILSVTISEK
jgi:cyclophilin family peptidyl-prolyl cis-trans isomerase